MLVGLLKIIFDVLIFLVSVASWVLLAYVLMSLLIPENKYTLLIGKYVEPLLAPLRTLLAKLIPKLGAMRVDFSPVALWLLLTIAEWLLRVLKNILL